MNYWHIKDQHIKEDFHMDDELIQDGGNMKLGDTVCSESCSPKNQKMILVSWQMVSNEGTEASQGFWVPNAISLKGRGVLNEWKTNNLEIKLESKEASPLQTPSSWGNGIPWMLV